MTVSGPAIVAIALIKTYTSRARAGGAPEGTTDSAWRLALRVSRRGVDQGHPAAIVDIGVGIEGPAHAEGGPDIGTEADHHACDDPVEGAVDGEVGRTFCLSLEAKDLHIGADHVGDHPHRAQREQPLLIAALAARDGGTALPLRPQWSQGRGFETEI